MATKKAAAKGKAKDPKVEAQSDPVTDADLAALGIESSLDVPLGGSQWKTISVEKLGFQFKGPDGNRAVPSFEGTIVHHHPLRTYYAAAELTGTPPDCFSTDGVNGSTYGACDRCPHSFNAAMAEARRNGQTSPAGQTCKEKHALYVTTSAEDSAWLLRVPTMSLGALKLYFKTLAVKGLVPIRAVTRFSTEVRKNKKGQDYGECKLDFVRETKKSELIAMVPQAKMLAAGNATRAAIPERAASSDESFA